MQLSDTNIRNVKHTDKVQKLSDGGGLYLHVSPAGGKLWRMAYRFHGKQKTLSFGAYPAVSLKDARQKRNEAKALLAAGVDPGEERKRAKVEAVRAAKLQTPFEAVAREWFASKTLHLTPRYRQLMLSRLEKYVLPILGGKPFATLEPADIMAAVTPVVDSGLIETAHRLVNLTGQICRYGRLLGYARFDPSAGLCDALPKTQTSHHASITDPVRIGHLLRDIDAYQGEPSICHALRILPYVFVRSSELRGAAWEEIDFAKAEWIIPAERMKMRRPHAVPLARQVVKLFQSMRDYSGGAALVFPGQFSVTRCVSDMGLLNALRRMGYARGELTVHGFRTMASTLLNEQGYRPDVIEAQLAHGEKNSIRAAYNHAEYLPERIAMMQEWADYLDGLRAGTV